MPQAQPRVSPETHQRLKMMSMNYQFMLKRQVSMGEIIRVALILAERHTDEFSRIIETESESHEQG